MSWSSAGSDGSTARAEFGLWSSMPDRSLTAISRARAGQPAMIRLIMPGPAAATLAARLPAVPITSAAQGSPPGPASRAPVGEQDERGDDLDAVDRQREGVCVPPSL